MNKLTEILPLRHICSAAALAILLAMISGCGANSAAQPDESTGHVETAPHTDDKHADDEHAGHDHAAESDPSIVQIPASVRENLGITFARAQARHVSNTLRVPGRFELRPDATREYRAPLAGRVLLLVAQYDRVTTGAPLYRLDSAQWRQMQQEYVNAQAEVLATSASLMAAQVASRGGVAAEGVIHSRINAGEAHIEAVSTAVETAEERLQQVQRLHEIVGGKLSEVSEARAQVASLKNELSQAKEDRAELEQQQLQLSTGNASGAFGTTETLQASALARRAEYEAAHALRELVLSSLLSIQPEMQPDNRSTTALRWKPDALITVRAASAGVVSSLGVTNGGFVEQAGSVLTIVDPTHLRFRGIALQSDLDRLQPEMSAEILRPGGNGDAEEIEALPATARLSLEADPDKRTLDIIADVNTTATWPRAGVSTNIELVLDSTAEPQLAIPTAAIVQDGLDKLFFRRDPHKPDTAHRVKADLGLSDGHWTAVESGLKAGDEVVLDGVYELKLATSAGQQKGGHFHADGTFHEGED